MHRSNNTLPPPNCRTEATLQLEKKLLISVLLEPGAKLFSFSALLLSFVKLVLVSSPFSVNAVCRRWKKSSPWMSETLVCFSDELAVSLKPLADFRMAVNVIISVHSNSHVLYKALQ